MYRPLADCICGGCRYLSVEEGTHPGHTRPRTYPLHGHTHPSGHTHLWTYPPLDIPIPLIYHPPRSDLGQGIPSKGTLYQGYPPLEGIWDQRYPSPRKYMWPRIPTLPRGHTNTYENITYITFAQFRWPVVKWDKNMNKTILVHPLQYLMCSAL